MWQTALQHVTVLVAWQALSTFLVLDPQSTQYYSTKANRKKLKLHSRKLH